MKLIYRNLLHLYILNTKHQPKKFKKQSHLSSHKNNKISKNKPTKGDKRKYSENYETMIKEIEDSTNRWKYKPCSWTGRINFVKIPILQMAIYRFMQSLPSQDWNFLQSQDKISYKLQGDTKDPEQPKQYWE